MNIVDLHADVLYKLLKNPELKWGVADPESKLDVTPDRLEQGGVMLQVFPVFLPSSIPCSPESLLRAAERFWSEVLNSAGLVLIREAGDIPLALASGQRAAILSLENAEGLREQVWALQLLYRLGLRLLGPTWNHANWACDGAMEPRGGGFTQSGKQLVTQCEELGILIDVSHLSDRGFWELADRADKPFFASHSNCRSLMDHPRNLTDLQIKAIIAVDGIIGLTFVPWFIKAPGQVSIDDLLRHVEHVCALGGAEQLSFGSDFDGITDHIPDLAHPGHYPNLTNALLKRYPESLVEGFLGGNAITFFKKYLSK